MTIFVSNNVKKIQNLPIVVKILQGQGLWNIECSEKCLPRVFQLDARRRCEGSSHHNYGVGKRGSWARNCNLHVHVVFHQIILNFEAGVKGQLLLTRYS